MGNKSPRKEFGRLHSFKNLLRNHTVSQTPSPSPSPSPESNNESNLGPSSVKQDKVQHSEPRQAQTPPKEPKPAAALSRKPVPGTRGVFVPSCHAAEHYAQRQRPNNPVLPPNAQKKPATMAGVVVVRFFSCEDLRIGREFLIAPDADALDSAAVAFLGWLWPPPEVTTTSTTTFSTTTTTSTMIGLNPGYRGLNLEREYGGYHLHYPDCAGAWPCRRDIGLDWMAVMKAHALKSPYTLLMIGVGLGEPSQQCC